MQRTRKIVSLSLLLLTSLTAAAEPTDCSVTPDAFSCRLDRALHLLHWVAGLMALLLVLVVWLAFSVYKRSRDAKLEPED